MHPRKEAGIVVDFVPKGATHNERVVSLHSLLDADFYREGARVTPAPRRRSQRRARRRLTPAPWLVPVTPDVRRRIAVIQREWQRVDPRFLDDDEQRYWATIAGRQIRFDERASFVQKLTEGRASKGALEQFLATCAAENPNRRLRAMALADRVSMRVERADFDDLVTLVTQAPHVGEGTARWASGSCCARSPTGSRTRPIRSSRAGRGGSRARRARCRTGARPASTRRRSGCSARSPTRAATGTRRTRRGSCAPRSSSRSRSAPRCSRRPRATRRARRSCIDEAREQLGDGAGGRARARREPARAEAAGEPQPPPPAAKKKRGAQVEGAAVDDRGAAGRRDARGRASRRRRDGEPHEQPKPRRSRRRRRPAQATENGSAEPAGRACAGQRRRAGRARSERLAQTAGPSGPSPLSSSSSRSRRKRVSSAASGVARGQVVRGLEHVDAPLELLDVGGRLGVGGDGLAHLLAVLVGRLLELGDVDVDAQQLAEAAHERERGARARRERHVVRHGRPEADRRARPPGGRRRARRRRSRSAPRSATARARAPRRAPDRSPRRSRAPAACAARRRAASPG